MRLSVQLGDEGTRDWQFGFGARTGLLHDAHQLDNIRFESGSFRSADLTSVEVSQNEQEFMSDEIQFAYLPPPHVSSLSVDRGPTSGLTYVVLSGYNFTLASNPLCKFGTSIVNGTAFHGEIACRSPPHAPQDGVALELSVNGQDFTGDGQLFSFYELRLSEISPSVGPANGSTFITLRGHGLSWGYSRGLSFCRFSMGSESIVAAASYLDTADILRCMSPVLPLAATGQSYVTISLNGQQFLEESLAFQVHNTTLKSLAPGVSLYHGGRLINITVDGLPDITLPSLSCKFEGHRNSLATQFDSTAGVDRWRGTALTPASVISSDIVSCVTPSALDAGLARSLSLDFSNGTLPDGVRLYGRAHASGGA